MDSLNLKGKNIALITPDMYGYPKEIVKTLEQHGANVIYFRDRPQGTTTRFFRNVSAQIHNKIKAVFLESILLKIRNQLIDYILIIKGTAITSSFLKKLKMNHSAAKIIMYQWDSNKIHPYLHLVDFVDTCFVFDPSDLHLHHKLKYLPLFFIDSYESIRDSNKIPDIDLLHIGTLHDGRYNQIKKIEKQLSKTNLKFYFYLFLPFTGWIKELLKGRFYFRVKFVTLSQANILSLYQSSKAVLDIPQVGQLGLTLRTFEVLGAYKKLITTNVSILEEEIYIPELVYVLNKDQRSITDFLISEVVITDKIKSKIEKYSIHSWVNQLFT